MPPTSRSILPVHQSSFCVGIVAVFMIVVLGCQSLGSGGWMRPALAAWLPLMVFAPLAAALSVSLQK